MKDIAGKTALITGGASGIGLGMARAFAGAGANIALADIDAGRLGVAAADLRSAGARVCEVVLDVADPRAWEAAAGTAEAALGPVQILCNNAGVGTGAADVGELAVEHWNWALGVNLTGVFLGSRTFASRLRAARLPGHIVNTASIMGVVPTLRQPAYVATKYGVIGLSETMRIDLAAAEIGVSVLCPGLVETPLRHHSQALRPGGPGGGFGLVPSDGKLAERPAGMSPDAIGRMTLEAIRANRFYIFPHPEYRDLVRQRMEAMLKAFREPAEPGYREDPLFLGEASRALFDQEL